MLHSDILEGEVLAEALKTTPRTLCIAGWVDTDLHRLVLIRSDFKVFEINLSDFRVGGVSTLYPWPYSYGDFKIADWGQTIRFGGFELATDILFTSGKELR